jgi:hypothetical protein
MKKFLTLALLSLSLMFAANTASALTYNDTQVAIFGSGNPNGGWTTDSNNNLEAGLRMKNRMTGDTTNTLGVYGVDLGYIPPANNRSWGQIEFFLNSDVSGLSGLKLTDVTWSLGYDTDSSLGVSMSYLNPLSFWSDNSLGTNATANGMGVETNNPNLFHIAMNSQNAVFFPFLIDPTLDSTFNYKLTGSVRGQTIVDTGIQAVFGKGGAPAQSVPDAGMTALLLGSSLFGLMVLKRKTGNTLPATG